MLKIDRQKFKAAMADSGLNARQLAARAGVGYSTVSRYDKGAAALPGVLHKVAGVLGVKPSTLIEL